MNQWMISVLVLASGLAANAGELKAVIGPNPAFALPADISTCRQMVDGDFNSPGLSKPTVDFGVFNLQWTGQNSVRISHVEIEFLSETLEGGRYVCAIDSSELAAMNLAFVTQIPGGNPNAVHAAQCGIRCGNIPFKFDVGSSFLQGTATIHGVEFDSQGRTTPISSQSKIAIEKRY